jgi:excisionase family DNA binding protein
MADKKLYTIEEVAKKFDVHVNTVRNLIRRGELKAMKFGASWRIPGSALTAYVSNNTRKALDILNKSDARFKANASPREQAALNVITASTPEDVVYPVNSPRYVEEDLFGE